MHPPPVSVSVSVARPLPYFLFRSFEAVSLSISSYLPSDAVDLPQTLAHIWTPLSFFRISLHRACFVVIYGRVFRILRFRLLYKTPSRQRIASNIQLYVRTYLFESSAQPRPPRYARAAPGIPARVARKSGTAQSCLCRGCSTTPIPRSPRPWAAPARSS